MISEDLSFVLESSRLFTFDNGPRRHCKNDLAAKSWNIIAHREPDAAAMVAMLACLVHGLWCIDICPAGRSCSGSSTCSISPASYRTTHNEQFCFLVPSALTLELPPSFHRLLRLRNLHATTAAVRAKRTRQDVEDYCRMVEAFASHHDLPLPGPRRSRNEADPGNETTCRTTVLDFLEALVVRWKRLWVPRACAVRTGAKT